MYTAREFLALQNEPERCVVIVVEDIDGQLVSDDQYFDELGRAIDEFPILPPRIRRRA